MNNLDDKTVTVVESGNGPYAQFVTAGHHVMAARRAGTVRRPRYWAVTLRVSAGCSRFLYRDDPARVRRAAWLGAAPGDCQAAPAVRTFDNSGVVDRFIRSIELSGDLNSEQRGKLLEIAERCPVSRTLQRPSEIVTELAPASAAAA
jgi:putative redox protein